MPSMLDGDVGHNLGGQRRSLPAMIPQEDGVDLLGEECGAVFDVVETSD